MVSQKTPSIDLWGVYPPPVGGVSIHVKRLFDSLLSNKINTHLYATDYEGVFSAVNTETITPVKQFYKYFFRYLFNNKATIIHSHTHRWMQRLFLGIKSLINKQKIIFTFHSFRENIHNLNPVKHFIIKLVFKFTNLFIATSESVKNKLIECGCPPNKIKTIIPYIKPIKNSTNTLDLEICNFLKKHKFIIVGNASNNNKYNNEDLYGIDMCIYLQQYLSSKNQDIGIIFVLTKTTDSNYLNTLENKIESLNIKKDFLLYKKPIDFSLLLENSNIFVRPTNTDSWPLSIIEALSLKKPTIASDVCLRHNGCILFKTRSQEDFNNKVWFCINNYQIEKDKLTNISTGDGFNELLSVYRNF